MRGGVAELRPEARYNQDARAITAKFALGVDILNVIAEARPDACTMSYPVMEPSTGWPGTCQTSRACSRYFPAEAAKIANSAGTTAPSWRVLPRDSTPCAWPRKA